MDVREKTASEKRLIDANELKKKMCFKCNDEYSDECNGFCSYGERKEGADNEP